MLIDVAPTCEAATDHECGRGPWRYSSLLDLYIDQTSTGHSIPIRTRAPAVAMPTSHSPSLDISIFLFVFVDVLVPLNTS